MRKKDFFKKLSHGIHWIELTLSISILMVMLVFLVNNVVAVCTYRSFLSDDLMLSCFSFLAIGMICLVGCISLSAIIDIRNQIEAAVIEGEVIIKSESEPESLSEAIVSNHGDDLEMVMEAIRHEDLEYRAIFDAEGNKLSEGTLQSSKHCNIPKDAWRKIYNHMHTDLHNHPGKEQYAFSGKDMYNLINLKFQRAIVVTPLFNYIMENRYWNQSDAPDAKEVQEYIDDFYSLNDSENVHVLRLICWSLFPRLYSCYISRRAAKKFGLKFRIKDLRLQKAKVALRNVFTTPRYVFAAITMSLVLTLTALPSTSISITDNSKECHTDATFIGFDEDGYAMYDFSYETNTKCIAP